LSVVITTTTATVFKAQTSSELVEQGARCRGNQHDDVISKQANTIADMRVRIGDLEACVRQLNGS